jgi:hypothetical protein
MNISDLSPRLVAFFGVLQVILAALIAFLGKIWLSRIQAREAAKSNERLEGLKNDLAATTKKLEAVLEQSIYMHKVHFDTEFKIYSELWPKLRAVKEASLKLSDDLSKDVSFEERLQALDLAVKELSDGVENQRPFFAANIASELFDLLDLTRKEAKRDADDRRSHPDRWIPHVERFRNLRNISVRCNRVCELIRSRITGEAVPLDEASEA